MKDGESSVRRRTYELTLPTILRADHLTVISGVGKSEMVEASLNWFTALVSMYASCTGVSQAQAARALVRAVPATREDPAMPGFLENPVVRGSMMSFIEEIGKNG